MMKKRTGPPTICPNGEKQKRINIALSKNYQDMAKKIGSGNLSGGIRSALDYYASNHK